jgi:hypothetical protein
MVVGGIVYRGRICFRGIVVTGGVFVYFEILARYPRVRVRSTEINFYYIFIINSTINRLINMHSIEV